MHYKIVPIGYIKSKFKSRDEAPKQGFLTEEVSEIVIYDEFKRGLVGLDNYKYLIILYWMHKAKRDVLFSEIKNRGIFATRSPDRPNPIGFAIVKVLSIEKNIIRVKYLDAIDGTPVVDIKPLAEEELNMR